MEANQKRSRADAGTIRPGVSRALRAIVLCFVLITAFRHGLWRPLAVHGVDYPKHWHAARAMVEGRSLYHGEALEMHFNYPQWAAVLGLGLALTDEATGEKLWKLMLFGSLCGCWVIAWRCFRPDPSRDAKRRSGTRRIVADGLAGHWALTSAALIVLFSPALARPVFAGNIDPFNALFATALVAAFIAGRERLSGVLWAMLCLIKLLPVSLAPVFLLGRRRGVIAGFLAFVILYALLLAGLGRIGEEVGFYRDLLPQVGFYWRGISRSLSRALLESSLPASLFDDPVIYNACTITILAILASVDTLAVAAVIGRGRPPARALEVSMLFAPMISPLFETHHLVLVLPVLFLQVRRWIEGEMTGRAVALLAPGWCVLCMDNFFQNYGMGMGPHGTMLYYASMAGTWWLIAVTTAEALTRDDEAEPRRTE